MKVIFINGVMPFMYHTYRSTTYFLWLSICIRLFRWMSVKLFAMLFTQRGWVRERGGPKETLALYVKQNVDIFFLLRECSPLLVVYLNILIT